MLNISCTVYVNHNTANAHVNVFFKSHFKKQSIFGCRFVVNDWNQRLTDISRDLTSYLLILQRSSHLCVLGSLPSAGRL